MILSILYCLFLLPPDAPPAGIREESDRGLGDMLVQNGPLEFPADKTIRTPDNLRGFPGNRVKDFTPPTDRLGDRINAQLKAESEDKNVKPVIAVKNPHEVAAAALRSGRPVMLWTFWPDVYSTTAEYFEELSEVQHILIKNPWNDAGEWIIYDSDGDPNSPATKRVEASKIFGKGCAAKVRKYWEDKKAKAVESTAGDGWYKDGDPSRLTATERDAVLATVIHATMPDGTETTMSIREAVSRGGRVTADVCRRAGFSPDEAAYAVALGKAQAGRSYASPAGGSSYGYAAQGRSVGYDTYRPPMPAPTRQPAPARMAQPPLRGG